MKTRLTALALTAATALSLAPKPALAGDKELALVGGFLGGLIVASAINDSRHDSYSDRHTTVVVGRRHDRHDRRGDHRPSGFWKEVTVKTWVPGCWVEERRRHGRHHRHFVAGHYEYRTDRVWVSYDRHDRRDRNDRGDCDDREVSYGYGHRR